MSSSATGAREGAGPPVLLPAPVVGWEDVLRVLDPGRMPTRARLRTLRMRGLLSEGVTAPRREGGRLAGSGTYFSVLWEWAGRLRSEGQDQDASRLEQDACQVEATFGRELTAYLSQRSLDQLPAARFFDQLNKRTAAGLHRSDRLWDLVLAAGTVVEMNSTMARVVGSSPARDATNVDLPARLLEQRGVAVGSPVWVVSRVVGGAAVVEVLPAVWAHLDHTGSEWFRWAASGWLAQPGTTEEELEDAVAERYRQTAAAMPDSDHLAGLLADARAHRLPRRLRPAG